MKSKVKPPISPMDGTVFCLIGNKKKFNERTNRMKKYNHFILILLLLALTLSGCGGGNGGGGNPGGGSPGSGDPGGGNPGGGTTYTGVAFKMVSVPMVSSFPAGVDDKSSGSVTSAYSIAETEVTYELWSAVYAWATDRTATDSDTVPGHGQYTFGHAGLIGNDGSGGAKEPVTTISWHDAMVWCNALTEYYNAKGGTGYACVYCTDITYNTPIRTVVTTTGTYTIDSGEGSQDNPCVNPIARGFRLPTSNEWELAARYIGDKNGDGDIRDSGEYYPGAYASGADADYNDTTATTDIDGDGDQQIISDVAECAGRGTAEVKSKDPNKLGIYDMTGNVYEWCLDWYDSATRMLRGGCCSVSTNSVPYLRLGSTSGFGPAGTNFEVGFRFARTE